MSMAAYVDAFFAVYQHPVNETGPAFGSPVLYEKSLSDFFVIFSFTVIFIRVRNLSESLVFLPVAQYLGIFKASTKKIANGHANGGSNGTVSPASKIDMDSVPVIAYKFCEQFWLLINHSISMTFGLVLLMGFPWAENILSLTVYNTPHDGLRNMWLGYSHEHKLMTGPFKLYYLLEISYWLHLAVHEFSIDYEARRWTEYEKKRMLAIAIRAREQNGAEFANKSKRSGDDSKTLRSRNNKSDHEDDVPNGRRTPDLDDPETRKQLGLPSVIPRKPPAGRRKVKKDAVQVLLHHVVTLFLVGGSYFVNLNRIGNLVLVIFDVSDVILSLAKVLKYIPTMPSIITDIIFVIFMISWAYTRHLYFVMRIIPSAYWDAPAVIKEKAFTGFANGHFYSLTMHKFFIAGFVILEILMCYWFALIVKVAVKVILGTGADDVRSDEEDEEVKEK